MSDGHGDRDWDCDVDLVLCIDATVGMRKHLEVVKRNALRFDSDLRAAMSRHNRIVRELRVRVLAFRDYYADERPMQDSGFLELPRHSDEFRAFVNGIEVRGGGNVPVSGLEALALALQSGWRLKEERQRHIILVWTDAAAHPLEKASGAMPEGYPRPLPESLDELTDWWDQFPTFHSKRLLICAPKVYPWAEIGENWDLTLHYPAEAGQGRVTVEYDDILRLLSASVAGC